MRYTISAFKILFVSVVLLSSSYKSLATEKGNLSTCEEKILVDDKVEGNKELNNSLPTFTNEDYAWRIDKLNEASPVQLDFNDKVRRYIDVYSVRHREKTSRILGLSEIYFPIFEEYLDKYDLPRIEIYCCN